MEFLKKHFTFIASIMAVCTYGEKSYSWLLGNSYLVKSTDGVIIQPITEYELYFWVGVVVCFSISVALIYFEFRSMLSVSYTHIYLSFIATFAFILMLAASRVMPWWDLILLVVFFYAFFWFSCSYIWLLIKEELRSA